MGLGVGVAVAVISVVFACGHRAEVAETADARPQCQQCGETRVQRVDAPPPRFSGLVVK